ncbi:uncharacterized protein [Bemisia tabaci]|uniref:uncharacterized protein isoform X3 n=1 Tax=Bemisia tabaci TaxID=7038 RepID=UPI003B27C106
MATHELLILRTARNYKLILQRLFFIEKPRMKWPLVFLIVLHQTLQITGAILFMIGSKASTHSIMAPATLAGKIYALILPSGYIVFAIWWRQIDYVVETLQEVNEILFYAQFPLLGSLRAAVITELESRHRTIILCLAYASHVAVSVYFLPSLTALFFNPSQLRLPVEMADPFPLLGIASNDLIRVLIYFGYFASYLLHFYITFTGAAILIVTVDSLKTAFSVCGLCLETLGHGRSADWEQFVDAVKLHQRLFRLAAKMKNAIEPLLTIIITGTVAYNAIAGLAFVPDVKVQNMNMGTGILITYAIIVALFVLPGTTSLMLPCEFFLL